MAAFVCARLLAVVALVALLGSACGNDDAPAEAPAPVVTEAPAASVEASVDEAVAVAVAVAGRHQAVARRTVYGIRYAS